MSRDALVRCRACSRLTAGDRARCMACGQPWRLSPVQRAYVGVVTGSWLWWAASLVIVAVSA